MAVGFAADKAALDARAGHVALQLRDTLDAAGRLKAWLDTKQDADLVALGYTSDEVAILKSAYTALDALRLVATGQRTVPEADNFLFWASKLTGVN